MLISHFETICLILVITLAAQLEISCLAEFLLNEVNIRPAWLNKTHALLTLLTCYDLFFPP